MNFTPSSNLATPNTAQFIQFAEYQARETHQKNTQDWQKSENLTAEALNRLDKVKKALNTVLSNVEGNLFQGSHFGISLVAYRREIVHAEANTVLKDYLPKIKSLAGQVADITRKIQEVANDPASLEAKKEALAKQLKGVCDIWIDMRDKVCAEKKELERSPLASDKRCLKYVFHLIDTVDKDGMGLKHPQYIQIVQRWQSEGKMDSTKSAEDCWKLKGKIKAMMHLEAQVAHLANGLHAAESCLASLEANAKNEKFNEKSNVGEASGVRMFILTSGLPGFGASSPSFGLDNSSSDLSDLLFATLLRERRNESNL
jgi:hypothetical protein